MKTQYWKYRLPCEDLESNYLTKRFKKPVHRSLGITRNRRSTDFETLKLKNVRWGIYELGDSLHRLLQYNFSTSNMVFESIFLIHIFLL